MNPVTGGGISSGMTGGWIAGQVAAMQIQKDKIDEKSLKVYTDWIHKEFGKNYTRVYNIKNAISQFTDDDLDNIAVKVKNIPREKRTLTKIFSTALIKKPTLVLDVIKVFAGI